MFDGLFGHQLLLLVPLHTAHHAGPDDADHGLFREVGFLHLLPGVGDDLTMTERWVPGAAAAPAGGFCSASDEPYLLLRVTAAHHLLELLLELLAGADGLLVAGKVGQLLQPGVSEVLRKMLAAPFVGRKEFLRGDEPKRVQLNPKAQSNRFKRALTISRLSMPTLRRLPATEFMSFSAIHDLNSLTAKAAETPAARRTGSEPLHACQMKGRRSLTLFDEVLVEKAAQDGGRDVAVGQQDAGQHGQLVALRLGEPLKEQQQLRTQKVGLVFTAYNPAYGLLWQIQLTFFISSSNPFSRYL